MSIEKVVSPIMTMLVAVTLALFTVVLFWITLDLVAVHLSASGSANEDVVELLRSFNENSRLIILGGFLSVFSLAGAFYLRLYSIDKHRERWTRTKVELGLTDGVKTSVSSYGSPEISTIAEPDYADRKESI